MADPFTNPHRFGDLDAWRQEAVDLHALGPVHRIEPPGYQPFWAVIGHDAVLDVERRATDFTNAPIPVLGSDEQLTVRAGGGPEIGSTKQRVAVRATASVPTRRADRCCDLRR